MDSIQKQENIAMQNTIANSGVCRAHFLRRNLVGSSFKKVDGLISKGADLLKQTMKVEDAKTLAARLPMCQGFCFRGEDVREPVEIYFKSRFDNAVSDAAWTSCKYSPPQACPAGHELRLFATPEHGYTCSECGAAFRAGIVLSGCRACNFDLCDDCSTRTHLPTLLSRS